MSKQLPTGPVNNLKPSKKPEEPIKATTDTIEPGKKTWVRKYLSLSRRTRIIIGVGVMAYAGIALYLSDQAEETFDLKATEEDRQRLKEMLPKIHTVDRSNPES